MPNNILNRWPVNFGGIVRRHRDIQVIFDDLAVAHFGIPDNIQMRGRIEPDIVEGMKEPPPRNPEDLLQSAHLKLHGSRFFNKKAEGRVEKWHLFADMVEGRGHHKPSDWDFYADEQDIQIHKIIDELGFQRVDEHYGGAGHDLLTVAVYKSYYMPNCQIVLKRHSEIYDQWLDETTPEAYVIRFWKRAGNKTEDIQHQLNRDFQRIAREKGIVL